MNLEDAITTYKNLFKEYYYNENPYLLANDIDPEMYTDRLADRVRKPYAVYPEAFTNKKILDFGSGLGDQSFIFEKIGNEVTAHDTQLHMLKFLVRNLPLNADIKSTLTGIKEKSYDTVFCANVAMQQKDPKEFFRSLFDIDFKTLVFLYFDNYTFPIIDSYKMYSEDQLDGVSSLVKKEELLAICEELNLKVIESDLSWDEKVPIDGIYYTETLLIVEKP